MIMGLAVGVLLTATRDANGQNPKNKPRGTVVPMCEFGCIPPPPPPPPPYGVLVDPDWSAISKLQNTNGQTVTFTVSNTGTETSTFDFTCSTTGGLTCVSVDPPSATLTGGGGGPAAMRVVELSKSVAVDDSVTPACRIDCGGGTDHVTVTVTFNVAVAGGNLILTASGPATDQGSYMVTAVQLAAPLVTLRNHNGDNRDRSRCLTVGAGEAAAWQCGDLLVSHALPGYATMGRERALTLVYNSAQAVPRQVFNAVVTKPSDVATPDSVYAEIRVNDIPRASAWFYAISGTAQIALAYDATSDPSGIYPITFVVRHQYAAGPYDAVVSDTALVVNRSQSEFGAGWWLAGVEQLVLNQPGNKILWIAGDGSAKAYRNVGANVWQAAAGAYRDTLRYDPAAGQYTRALRHGMQVKFDAGGRHIETVNRAGHRSFFTWNGSPLRLTSIQVPPGGAGTLYTLTYAAGALDYLSDPAFRVLDATMSGGRLLSLRDADNNAVNFAYDGAGRLTARTTRRGYKTEFAYAKGLRVTQVKVPLDPARGDTAVTIFDPWDEKALPAGGSGRQLPWDTAFAGKTTVVGPRLYVADDATFWVDRWGAPTQIADPLGYVTKLVRGDPAVPALVTNVTSPDGRIATMTWDARGNLLQTRDSTSHLPNGMPTRVSRWTYGVGRDSPDIAADSTTGGAIVTRYAYNAWGETDSVIAPNGHVTKFQYVNSGSLVGLLEAMIERNVRVWDSVSMAQSGPRDVRTSYTFNTLGNIASETVGGRLRRFGRDLAQRVDTLTDPGGHLALFSYDVLNRALQVVQYASGGVSVVSRRHYNIDVLDSIIDPRGVLRRYEYDAVGQQVREIDDFGHVEELFRDRAGLIDSVRPRYYAGSPFAIRHTYDALGRLVKTSWPRRDSLPADSVQITYDIMNRMLTQLTSSRKVVRTYYATGAIRSEVQSNATGGSPFTQFFGYDGAGRRTWLRTGTPGSLTYSDSIAYEYEPTSGDLKWIRVRWRGDGSLKDSVRYVWDAMARRDSVIYGNGIRLGFAYDSAGAFRSLCSVHPGGPVSGIPDVFDFQFMQTWVDQDEMIRRTDTRGGCGGIGGVIDVQNNTYDQLHQLLTQSGGGTSRSYAYDISGNMTQWVQSGTAGFKNDQYIMNPGHNQVARMRRLDDPNDGFNYLYDDNGGRREAIVVVNDVEQPGYIGRRQYWYDGLGRTTGTSEHVCAVQPDGSCFYQWLNNYSFCKYDPQGRLYDPCDNEGNRLGFDGENVIRTGDDTAPYAWTFVQGPGLDDPLMGFRSGYNMRLYWITDGAGRQLAIGNIDGYDYTSSNEVVYKGGKYAGGTGNANTYDAERNGNNMMADLSFFRNRFYDQRTGRWTQEDPLGTLGGFNLYAYAGNNPVQYLDPFGLVVCLQGTDAEVALLKRGLEQATETTITLDKKNCVISATPSGASGFSEIQQRFTALINSPDTFFVAFTTNPLDGSSFGMRDLTPSYIVHISTLQILRERYTAGGWFKCTFGIRTKELPWTMGSVLAHELVGHGGEVPLGRRYDNQDEAIRIENLYHAARAEGNRCSEKDPNR